MAAIHPFAALRPASQAASAVAAVPYDVVNADEARALTFGNPLSFLHVSRPEIELPTYADPYADDVYARAAENFQQLRALAPLVVEDTPSFYIYRLQMGAHVQSGIAGCFSLDEYDSDVIKKHEKTRPEKEDDRTRHMLALGAQTGPVFLTYRAASEVDAVVSRVVGADPQRPGVTPPLYDLVAPDEVRHVIWRIPADENAAVTAAFAKIPALYIADGHHRAASAARARAALSSRGPGEHDRVLAVAFPDTETQILPYHRVVRDLNGLAIRDFVAGIAAYASVGPGGLEGADRCGRVGMYLGGEWHTIDLGEPPNDAGPVDSLDVSRLQNLVLEPLLGIRDVRTDKRIDFVGGIRGSAELVRLVDGGSFAAAFALFPVTVHDLMRIADAGGIMPPKSTWFEPKLRDGLLSHLI